MADTWRKTLIAMVVVLGVAAQLAWLVLLAAPLVLLLARAAGF